MIRIPVHHTITCPSEEFNNYIVTLSTVAAYAKAAHQMDLYNQIKEIHDNLVRQYNEQNKPKKKGFWEQFKDNLSLNMDTHFALHVSYLEDNASFNNLYEYLKNFPQEELLRELRKGISVLNSLFR